MGYSLPRPSCLIAKQPSLFWLDIERFPQQQCIPVTSSSDDQLPTLSGAHIAMRASSSRRQPISCERLVQLGTAAVLPGAARPKIRVRMRHLSAITVHLHNERRLSPFFGEWWWKKNLEKVSTISTAFFLADLEGVIHSPFTLQPPHTCLV